MKKINKIIFPVLVGLLLFIYALLNTNLTFQNDIFYTIKNGEHLIQYGFDFLDHSSQFVLPYLYPHYLFDLFLYAIYKGSGFLGIYFFQVILFFLLGLCYFKLLKKKTNTIFFSLLVTILFMSFFAPFISARVQLISYFIILLEHYLLTEYEKKLEKKYLFLLPVLSCLLSQFHGAVLPFFFCLFMPYIASYIIHYVLKIEGTKTLPDNKMDIKFFFCIMVLSFLTTLFNPTGIESILYSIKIGATSTMNYIKEHQAPTIQTMPQFYIVLFIILLTNAFVSIQYKTSDVFLILGILLMSFISLRHISFLLLLVIPIFFVNLISGLSRKKVEIYDNFFLNISKKVIFLVLILIVVRNISYFGKIGEDVLVSNAIYPVNAADYLLENVDIRKIHLFHSYSDGSYLSFRGIPVFMDSRSDLYTKEFNKRVDIFDDYIEIMNTGSVELLEDYEITHALLSKTDKLTVIFKERYDVEYEDDCFILFSVNLSSIEY